MKNRQMSKKNIISLKKLHVFRNYVETTSLSQRLTKKFNCSKKKFLSLNVNLSDINNFTYANSLDLTKSINKNEIKKTIAKLKQIKHLKQIKF